LNEQYAQVTTAFGSAYPKTVETANQLAQTRASMVIEEGRIREKSRINISQRCSAKIAASRFRRTKPGRERTESERDRVHIVEARCGIKS